ncbi:uncharacterized protein ALTATR162_LOCUS3923 [Alternaria atra]|uniref:Uncharacterized protein n=1 Tax=Alternaria atra TaxID=119953 RepID=A0A8J2I3L1_9PLEO|nr:uncharacterized protein ALTATR162_LOCUS3923 [Alternaria atra]CAG5155973.1 unnamed protein product [Alternaria atra]
MSKTINTVIATVPAMIPPFAPFERPFESVEAALVTAGVVEVVEVEEVDIVEEAVELTGSGAARPVTTASPREQVPASQHRPDNLAQRPEVESEAERFLLDTAIHAIGPKQFVRRIQEVDYGANVFSAKIMERDHKTGLVVRVMIVRRHESQRFDRTLGEKREGGRCEKAGLGKDIRKLLVLRGYFFFIAVDSLAQSVVPPTDALACDEQFIRHLDFDLAQ